MDALTAKRRSNSGRIYGRHELKWDSLKLRLKSGRLLATVEPDAKLPKMYRVRLPGAGLTDMVNLTWAKDAAISLVLGDLNKQGQQETAGEASPMRYFAEVIPRIASRL